MKIFDIVLIIVLVLGVWQGRKKGVIKTITDLIFLYGSMILSGILIKYVINFLYEYVPFFNFSGKPSGIMALNILLWYVLTFILITFIIIGIINFILKKTNLKMKIVDSMVETTRLTRILGAVFAVPLTIVFLFNVLFLLSVPSFNINDVYSSKFSKLILENIPVVSNQNKKIYETNFIAYEMIVENGNADAFDEINTELQEYLVSNEIIDDNTLALLNDKGKMEGKDKKSIFETLANSVKIDELNEESQEEDDYGSDFEDEEEYDGEDEYYEEDEEYYDEESEVDEYYDEESYDEYEYSEDEEFYDEEYYDEEWDMEIYDEDIIE